MSNKYVPNTNIVLQNQVCNFVPDECVFKNVYWIFILCLVVTWFCGFFVLCLITFGVDILINIIKIQRCFVCEFQLQLVQWINDAGMAEGNKKSDLLRKIIEVLLHQASLMLPVYIDNILSFVSDKSTDVKKQVIAFIEEIR